MSKLSNLLVLTELPGQLLADSKSTLIAWHTGKLFKVYMKQITGTKEEFLAMGYNKFTFLTNNLQTLTSWQP